MAIIRVSGHLGAGKTTICERLAETLGYRNYYTGDIFNQMAREKGLSKEQFYKEMSAFPELEKEIDKRQEQLMLTEDNLIVQGRIAPFLKHNPKFKKINVFFRVSDEEGARRQLRRSDNKGKTYEEMLAISRERTCEERKRYGILYPHIPDYLDEKLFDIVIETENKSEDDVYREVMAKICKLI
jgi:predicted cytidylate kinase